jgi:hypothetical protein
MRAHINSQLEVRVENYFVYAMGRFTGHNRNYLYQSTILSGHVLLDLLVLSALSTEDYLEKSTYLKNYLLGPP